MWGLTTLAGTWLVLALLGVVLSGAASMGRAAMVAGGRAAAAGPTLGIDADEALRPVNERLRAEGKPAINSEQVQGAVKDVVGGAARGERIDRSALVRALSENTALSRRDAEDVATRLETQLGRVRGAAQKGALSVADATGKGFWGVFGSLFLGLIAAVSGAVVGVSRFERRRARRIATAPVTPPPPPLRQPLPTEA